MRRLGSTPSVWRRYGRLKYGPSKAFWVVSETIELALAEELRERGDSNSSGDEDYTTWTVGGRRGGWTPPREHLAYSAQAPGVRVLREYKRSSQVQGNGG